MPRTFHGEDTKLLGYVRASTTHDGPSYTVIDAEAQAGLEAITTRFIYFKSNCSRSAAGEALRQFNTGGNSRLLQPASGRMPLTLGEHPVNYLEDLVWQRLVDQYFDDYLHTSRLSIVADEHFIPPSDTKGSDVMTTLNDYVIGKHRNDDGSLMVISAGAGVGKTTVSRTLFRNLVEKTPSTMTIPIYVEAQHWKNQLRPDSSFYDVICNSLALLDAKPLPEDIFFHALRKGYLSFIFDGFDELCSYQYDSFDPLEILGQLLRISEESEARISITTRSGFWNARVAGDLEETSSMSMISLVPFNTQQSRGYFRMVFGQGTHKYKLAETLHKALQDSTRPRDHTGSVRDEVFNLPFCVRVLADYVNDGGELDNLREAKPPCETRDGAKDELLNFYRLLLAICERECTRQRLETSAEEQVLSFVDVAAADDARRPHFALSDLLSLAGGFRTVDEAKIGEHALLERHESDGFCFRYEFLAPYLRALGVRNGLMDESLVLQGGLVKALERERSGEGEVSENLSRMLHPQDLEAVVGRCHGAVAERNFSLASFFLNLGFDLIKRRKDLLSDADRTDALFFDGRYSSRGREIVGWRFFGTMENLDFTNVTFRECHFSDVKFRHCGVGGKTVFDNCTFEGSLNMSPQSKWGSVDYRENCNALFPADTSWEKVLKRAVGKKAERVDVLLGIALSKFWPGGRFRGSIVKANWHRGWRGETREAKRVLDSMLKAKLIAEVHISGVDGGGYAFDRSALADLQNYMDGRQKSGKVRVVFGDLMS